MAEVEEGDAAVYYTDALTGARRQKRRPRKVSRGPYSTAEKKMKQSFEHMVNVVIHRMDGELSDLVCAEFNAWFVMSAQIMRRYSFQELPDPSSADWEALRLELDLARRGERPPEEEFDVGKLT